MCQHPASTTDYHFPAAEQKLYQKTYLLPKNIEESSGKKSGDWAINRIKRRQKEQWE